MGRKAWPTLNYFFISRFKKNIILIIFFHRDSFFVVYFGSFQNWFKEIINTYNKLSAWNSKLNSLYTNSFPFVSVIAELLRAEGSPAVHPFFRNFGNPSSPENLVMTLPYERASERPSVRPSVQTLGEWDGSLKVTRAGKLKNAIFSWRDENSLLYCYVNKR